MTETPFVPDPRWLAGYIAAKTQAAALARFYERELRSMAVDDAMLDPARDGDRSVRGVARSTELDAAMWEKAAASRTAEDIADGIDLMQPAAGDLPPADH